MFNRAKILVLVLSLIALPSVLVPTGDCGGSCGIDPNGWDGSCGIDPNGWDGSCGIDPNG